MENNLLERMELEELVCLFYAIQDYNSNFAAIAITRFGENMFESV